MYCEDVETEVRACLVFGSTLPIVSVEFSIFSWPIEVKEFCQTVSSKNRPDIFTKDIFSLNYFDYINTLFCPFA